MTFFCKYSVFFKKSERAIFLSRSFKKSDKEQFTLLLFTKRATKSDLLCCSLPKESQRANCSFDLLKRAQKSKSLFHSLQKEQKSAKRANHSVALFVALFSKKRAIRSFPKRVMAQPWLYMKIIFFL